MRTLALAALVPLALACGGARIPDLAAWEQTSAELRASVQSYREAVATAPTAEECQARRAAYLEQAQPKMELMRQMSGEMDLCLRRMNMHRDADLEPMCGSMRDELSRYEAEGCGSQDATQNQYEARVHCDRMVEWLDAADARGQEMGGMGAGMQGDACTPH